MNDFIEQLKSVRGVARRMHASYLKKHGLYDRINELVTEDFNIREKIDIIVENAYNKCHNKNCNHLAKFGSLWCSLNCMNSDEDSPARKIISSKNIANASDRMRKTRETNMKTHGVEHVRQRLDVKTKIAPKMFKVYNRFRDETFEKYGLNRDDFLNHDRLASICKNSGLFKVAKEHFNDMPPTTIISHFRHIGFDPGWKAGASSHGEREIFDFVKELFPNDVVLNNHRKLMKKELDIYIPHRQLGIEYHGLYWHSDKLLESKGVNPKLLHLSKYELAKSHGVTLLQFFADEWSFKQNIVKSIIKSKLGIFDTRLYARKCVFYNPSSTECKIFFEENHLQGWAVGSPLALKYDNEIVAMISTSKTRFSKKNEIELIRFATKLNTQVVGGFSKLLAKIKSDLHTNEIITFADIRYSSGEIYKKFGTFVSQTTPAYFWVDMSRSIRLNRFKTQKHKLSAMLGDKFDPNETEEQNMTRCGYIKIYDCGQLKFTI